MPDLPSGTVTFLFTDIEGSSRLWEQDFEGMSGALACHNAVLRQAIEENDGYIFKFAGDGYCAAFRSATEAVCAALAMQTRLQDQSWGELGAMRVRIALHTGTALELDGDYLGPSVNRVARLLGVGHGGQILLSQPVCDLIRAHLPPEGAGWGLRDLGYHRLRDLQQPERIYQLLHPSLPADFLPLRSVDALPNNLPRSLSEFIGREAELVEARRLLGRTRLLTLVGPGGCGKTRMSLQVGAEVLGEYADGVWFAELAALSDPELVPQAVASQLGVPDPVHRPPLAALLDHLRSRAALLILDNCEHVAEAAARLTDGLLRGCPELKVLATSREALGVEGETLFTIPSLSHPGADLFSPARTGPDPPTPTELQRDYEAVRLFVERAMAAQPGFRLTARNAPAVAEICRRLDGIPLILELAAARVKLLSVEQIRDRLNDRFRLLTGGARTALPRHQTLRAAIDWSYDRLSAGERTLFRRLAVFAGGWTLDAAESVCGGAALQEVGATASGQHGLESWEVLELMARLVDCSLVQVEHAAGAADESGLPLGGLRYRMLETIREYARERLTASGEVEAVAGQHLRFYMGLAEQAEPHLEDAEQRLWLDRLEREQDNIRSALAWSAAGEERLRLAAALWRFWYQRGPLAEGRAWLEGTLGRAQGCDPALVAKACSGAGNLAMQQGEYDAAHRFHERALNLRRELHDQRGIAASLINLGIVGRQRGSSEGATGYFEESLGLNRQLGNEPLTAAALVNLAVLAQERGDAAAALPRLEESREIYARTGDDWRLAIVLNNLAQCALHHGDHAGAAARLRESLRLFRRVGDRSNCMLCLNTLAMLAAAEGLPERAALLLAAEEAAREAADAPIPLSERPEVERCLDGVRESLGVEAFHQLWQEGKRLTLEQAIEQALGESSA